MKPYLELVGLFTLCSALWWIAPIIAKKIKAAAWKTAISIIKSLAIQE